MHCCCVRSAARLNEVLRNAPLATDIVYTMPLFRAQTDVKRMEILAHNHIFPIQCSPNHGQTPLRTTYRRVTSY